MIRMKLIFILVGKIAVFGTQKTTRGLTDANAPITNDCLEQLVERKHHWPIYIHNFYIIGHYNSSVRIIDLVSHTTFVLCVHFIHKWRDLQFKVDSERQIFEKLSPKIYFAHIAFFFFFWWPGVSTNALNLISQQTIY